MRHLLLKFIVVAMPVFIILNACFLYGFSDYRLGLLRSEQAASIAARTYQLSTGLSKVLAQDDTKMARTLLATAAGSTDIRCVMVSGPDGTPSIAWPFPNCARTMQSATRISQPLSADGKNLGKLTILFDEDWILENFQKEIVSLTLALLFASFGAFAASLLAHRVTIGRPIGHLMQAIENRRRFNQLTLVNWQSRDELGRIANCYNAMTEAEEEQRQALSLTLEQLQDEIEERKRTEQTLRETQEQLIQASKLEAMGTLASGIAHEINTPLQYLQTNLDFVKDGISTYQGALASLKSLETISKDRLEELIDEHDLDFMNEELSQSIDDSLEGSASIERIVKAVKQFSRPDQSQKEPCNLQEIIEGAAEVCRNQWKYSANLVMNVPADCPAIPGFPSELGQVFLNLIVNAAHAIGEQKEASDRGTISIQTEVTAKDLQITVADTGKGMTEEVKARIFDMFYTTKAPGKGTGQGLAISQAIIMKKHQGTITVDSTPGKGTTFRITLPRADQAETASPTAQSA